MTTHDPKPSLIQHPPRLADFMRDVSNANLINLAAGVPSYDILPLKHLEASAKKTLKHEGILPFCYQNPEGDLQLRNLIAQRLNARGADIKGKDIIITTGCTQALYLMIQLWVQPGDVVAIEAPGYYGMIEHLSARKAKVLPLPIDLSTGIRLEEAKRLLTKYKPKLLIVCSCLSNPSGATIPVGHRKALVQFCKKLKIKMIEDDIYGELCDDGGTQLIRSFDPQGNTVAYVSSFSKTAAPGLRMGVCIPGKAFEDCTTLKCQQDLHSSVISQFILKQFIQNKLLDQTLPQLRAFYKKRRKIALKTISEFFPKGTRVSQPEGGYMLWAEFSKKYDLKKVAEEARRKNIVFCKGQVFYPHTATTSCMRLNIAKASQKDLVFALKTIGKILC